MWEKTQSPCVIQSNNLASTTILRTCDIPNIQNSVSTKHSTSKPESGSPFSHLPKTIWTPSAGILMLTTRKYSKPRNMHKHRVIGLWTWCPNISIHFPPTSASVISASQISKWIAGPTWLRSVTMHRARGVVTWSLNFLVTIVLITSIHLCLWFRVWEPGIYLSQILKN